ncbi:T9SS type A sorting domain-containing protein [Flavobacterium sp. CG_9.1]|uniref:T9SS type A sorting domain-containing protein n=1 Tax=Flavobacterium sp. CG_9.1 TaxID=2787728 RepID=UPI002108566D|nr:T9SS type A sorting domain-containing protein [Flavobacterium sp. CG_9.1]
MIYPNPVSNSVTIQADKPMTGVKIYSILGALMQEIKTSSENLNLDLSAYSQGVYFIRVYNEDGFTSKKVIKK